MKSNSRSRTVEPHPSPGIRLPVASSTATPNRHRVALLGLVLLSTVLRLAELDLHDLWIDEAFSWWMALQPPTQLIAATARIDHHSPLYYLLLHSWVQLAGDREFALRYFSGWLGIISIPLYFQFARGLAGSRPALLATSLLAISPFHVYYAQEARMYTLLATTALLALWLAHRLLSRPFATRREKIGLSALLAGVQALVMWSHNTAAFLFPLVLNLMAILAWFHQGRPPRDAPGPLSAHAPIPADGQHIVWLWISSQVGALLLWALWLPAFLQQLRTIDQRFWVTMPTVADLWLSFQSFGVGHPPAWWGWGQGWVAVLVAFVLLGLYALRRHPRLAACLLVLWLAAPVAALLVSLRRPVFLESTLIWTTFAFFLILALGIRQATRLLPSVHLLGRSISGLLAGALLVAGMAGGLRGHYAGGAREPWQAAATIITEQARPHDLILFHAAWTQLPFLYYADYDQRGSAAPGEIIPPVVYRQMRGVPGDFWETGELEPLMRAEDVPRLQHMIAGYERVWLVYSHAAYSDPLGLVPLTLQARMPNVTVLKLPEITLYRFER